jgi:hypothetical protein
MQPRRFDLPQAISANPVPMRKSAAQVAVFSFGYPGCSAGRSRKAKYIYVVCLDMMKQKCRFAQGPVPTY